jgi:hypothetical protein
MAKKENKKGKKIDEEIIFEEEFSETKKVSKKDELKKLKEKIKKLEEEKREYLDG